jgi:hypothetical protein
MLHPYVVGSRWYVEREVFPPTATYDIPPTVYYLPLEQAVGSKQKAVGREQVLFILAPDS